MILQDNLFIENLLPRVVLGGLSAQELAEYRRPLVGTVVSNGKLYFMTAANTWKVRRLAPAKGKRLARPFQAPCIACMLRRQSARALLRVGIVGHFFGIVFDLRYPGEKTAVYEIELDATEADPSHGDARQTQAARFQAESRQK